jgi:hypothetical protein
MRTRRRLRLCPGGAARRRQLHPVVRRLLRPLAGVPPLSTGHWERMLSASETDNPAACLMTSAGTQAGKGACRERCAPLGVCSFHTFASCSFRKRRASLTSAGHSRRCTYVILPSTSLHTNTSGLSQTASAARKISFPFARLPPQDSGPGRGQLEGQLHDVQRMRPPPSASPGLRVHPRHVRRTLNRRSGINRYPRPDNPIRAASRQECPTARRLPCLLAE